MQIEVEVRVYNHAMRERRKELGLTQAALRDLSGVTVEYIGRIERLQLLPNTRIGTIRDKLLRIADALELPFREVFPDDYLEMIRKELLPKSTRYQWVRDFSLDALPAPTAFPALMETPNLSEEVEIEELAETLGEAVKRRLPPREQRVIELRFGLNGERVHTLKEASQKIIGAAGVPISRARVQQLEYSALCKLRHPLVSKRLREHLETSGGPYRNTLRQLREDRKKRRYKQWQIENGPRLEREARERRNKQRAELQRKAQEKYDAQMRPDDSERTL